MHFLEAKGTRGYWQVSPQTGDARFKAQGPTFHIDLLHIGMAKVREKPDGSK